MSTSLTDADLAFPPGFLWGTASSAHQVEGDNTNNQWSLFERRPGAIADGSVAGRACNWWADAEADFDRMAALGLNAHRLSLEWSRIEPQPGRYDDRALARYRAMLLALRERNIQPWVALHHFTNPIWLETMGGWENPSVVARFAAYARIAAEHLGDLCTMWLTFNEPLVYLGQGWVRGLWPPQRPHPILARRVFLHLLEGHAAAYHALHAAHPTAQVGIAKAMRRFAPLRPRHPGDRVAARLRTYLYEDLWFAATVHGRLLPPLGQGHRQAHLAGTLDFIGINYYARRYVHFTPNPLRIFAHEENPPDGELADAGSHGPPTRLDPAGLLESIRYVRQFNQPIYITEHGLPDAADSRRPRWLLAHLLALHRALAEGADVRGYFHWTLVDNFEWNDGWSLRFGLIALDPATQTRTPRPSAQLYATIARANALPARLLHDYAVPNLAE